MYFNLYLHYPSIFFYSMLYEICLWSNRCRTCTCMTYSEPMCHPFVNDASHMNLWDAWFPNCPAYFGHQRMATVVCYLVSIFCVFHSWFRQRNPIVLRHTDIGRLIGEKWGYATKIMNERYTRQTSDNIWRSLFLGGFRTYIS
jgi:hypothetical protein